MRAASLAARWLCNRWSGAEQKQLRSKKIVCNYTQTRGPRFIMASPNNAPSRMSLVDSRGKSSGNSSFHLGMGGGNLAWRASGKSGFKVPKYQNTYRLEPYLPFRCEVSDKILKSVMTKFLEGVRYESETCSHLSSQIAAHVREKLYKTTFDRVKYVVMISIIENGDQSVCVSHGRLWDEDRDAYSTYLYESPYLYAVGIIAALNYE